MGAIISAETTNPTGKMPEYTKKKNLSPILKSTTKNAFHANFLTVKQGTGTNGSAKHMKGTQMFDSGSSSEMREKAKDVFDSNGDSDSHENQIADQGAEDLDNESTVNDAISNLQEGIYKIISSCEPENRPEFSLGSEGLKIALSSFPLNKDGLSSPTGKPTDTDRLPGPPKNLQLGSKRKNSFAVEVRTNKIYRNIRPRIDTARSDFQYDDACEKGHTSPLLSPQSNARHPEVIYADREPSRSGESPHSPRRDRWLGRFSSHPALSDLSFAVKDEIERVCNGVLRPDFAEIMAKHIPTWLFTGLCHSLLEAVQPKVDLFKDPLGHSIEFSAEGDIRYLKSRFAHIRLYLDYIAEFTRQKKSWRPDLTAKTKAINVICGTSSMPKLAADKARRRFHQYKLIGERWWLCGCFLGHGFFLLCSEKTGKKVHHKKFLLDEFILYMLSNRTDLLACSSKFDHMADSLLAGRTMSVKLSEQEIRRWICEAKDAGPNTIFWERWNTNALASKASEFLLAHPPMAPV